MEKTNVHFLSQSVDWATPKGVYDELDAEFHFNDDPCPLYGADGADGLSREWGSSVFLNPPYGRVIGQWTAKALKEAGGAKPSSCSFPVAPIRFGGIETL